MKALCLGLPVISQATNKPCGPSSSDCNDVLHFVTETNRHGARAPSDAEYNQGYTVGAGMLTPQGMRQRYLLGALSRQRYTETYALLDPEMQFNEVVMASTNVPRTYQSGYSQILGLFPPSSQPEYTQLSQAEVSNLKNSVKGVPPF